MRILINISSLKFKGGVVKIFRSLGLNTINNIDYFVFMKPGLLKNPIYLMYRYLVFFKKIQNYDIIHLNPSFNRNALWRDYLFLRISYLFKKKIIVFFHGWDDRYEEKVHRSKVLLNLFQGYNKSSAFIILGKVFREKLINLGISSNKKFYFETTVADDVYFNERLVRRRINDIAQKRSFQILFISRIVKNKGMDLALETVKIIQERLNNIDIILVIAGDGDMLDWTKNYANKLNIKNVRFTGHIENQVKHDTLSASDIMLFPTKYGEGLPNSIMEGCLYGMPIITRKVGGIGDWIKNDKNGYLSQSTTPDDFADYIVSLIDNPQKFQKISENNLIMAMSNFTKSKMQQRIIGYYREIYESNF